MKNICFYFQIHQPYRLRQYRFFNIGKDHFYFDDFHNRSVMQRVAADCYLPMNTLLLSLIKEYGQKVKVSFSISGSAIEQFKMYTPEVIDSFKALAKTGCVEFMGETYSHSLSSIRNKAEFENQIVAHRDLIEELFGARPTTFRNTELIYSDAIGAMVEQMGYNTMVTEGTKHVLGWKSPNFVYSNPIKQNLKLLLRNYKLSDDIAFRYPNRGWVEYPLTADRYLAWLEKEDQKGEIVNLFMDYETFGEHIKASDGIFEFMQHLIKGVAQSTTMQMNTPSLIAKECQSVALLHVPEPISWADEERDLSAWTGNELQDEAISKLYELRDAVLEANDPDLNHVWLALQNSDHFYYMCTKWFSDGDVHSYFNPYDTPYDAFINYMNVFSDFKREVMIKLGRE